MKYYRIKPDLTNYTELVFKKGGIYDKTAKIITDRLMGHKLDVSIITLRADYYTRRRKKPDIIDFYGKFLINDIALKNLKPAISDQCQIIEVLIGKNTWHLLNPTTMLDCIDLENSDIDFGPNGIIFVIHKLAFKQDIVITAPIFLLSKKSDTYIIDANIKNIICENNINGLLFHEIM